mgnify:FL=1
MADTAATLDAGALTRHIETRYHARHREQLPLLVDLAEKVEAVHFGEEGVPAGLSVLLSHMNSAIEIHMKKEEAILFPAIRSGGVPGITKLISVMRASQDHHVHELAQIRRMTDGPRLPEGACGSWMALYNGLEDFIADLEEHIHLENDVLFPIFEKAEQHD